MSAVENLDKLRGELHEFYTVLSSYDDLLSVDANDAEILSERADALAEIASLESRIAAAESAASSTNQDNVPLPSKWDPTKHPKFSKASSDAPPPPPPADEGPTVFNVKDLVLAKWKGDKQFYEATIISKTGSSADPVYTVTFKIDNSTESGKRKHEIRAMPGRKRKAEAAPAAPSPALASTPDASNNGAVITAAPVVDKSAIKKKEPSMVSDGPTRMQPEKKKLKGGKAMENKKANWQSFMSNGPKKSFASAIKPKESMFRTPEAPNAKVGVVGSGKPMQKDPSRSKWGATNGRYARDDEE